jgi:hypothetical protein
VRDKYKEEIEEILRKAGEVAPSDSAKKSERHPEDRPLETRSVKRPPVQKPRVSSRRWTLTSGKLMLAGLVLFLIGIAVRPLMWLGLAALVGAYLLYFLKPRPITQEKRWRGRSVEDTTSSPWDWFKRRFKG